MKYNIIPIIFASLLIIFSSISLVIAPPPSITLTGFNSSEYWDLLDTPADINLTDLGDVNASTPTDTHVLSWSNAQKMWVPTAPGAVGDTNETVRFLNLVNSNCGASQQVIGVYANGTVECAADATGSGGIENNTGGWNVSFNTLMSFDWTNITITESQIKDLIHTTDTNESTRFNNLVVSDCPAGQLVIGVQANGTVLCAADANGLDGNASSICNSAEVLLGNGSCRDSANFFDDTTIADTNETLRMINAIDSDCGPGEFVRGLQANGTVLCDVDTGGGSGDVMNGTIGWTLNFTSIYSDDWTNVTLTESQIKDLTHTTDTNESTRVNNLVVSDCPAGQLVIGVQANGTVLCAVDNSGLDGNASSICDGENVLLGNGSCSNSTAFFDDTTIADTNESTRFGALVEADCGPSQQVIGVQANGTVLCAADAGDSGNYFDQQLNTTSNVTFGNAEFVVSIPNITIKDLSATGSLARGLINFKDSLGNEQGFIGDLIAGDSHMYFRSYNGGIILGSSLAQEVVRVVGRSMNVTGSVNVSEALLARHVNVSSDVCILGGNCLSTASGLTNNTEGAILNFTRLASDDWSNATLTESQIKDLTHTTDTNETSRLLSLIDSDCSAGQQVIGVQANGTVLCVADAGASGVSNNTEGWIVNFTTLASDDWSNASLTESQITDLSHTVISSQIAYENETNIFAVNQNLSGNNLTDTDCIFFRSGGKICSG